MNTTFDTTLDTDSSPSAIRDGIFSAVADAVTRTRTRTTIPSMSPSLYDSSNNDPSYLIYNNDLHFDTVIAIIVAVAPAVAVGAPSVVKTKTSATIFIILLCSHIIDHGSVLYLIQQILLYNQQYVFSCAVLTTDMTCDTAVLVITKISSAIYDEDSSAFTIVTTAVTMTTVFHESPSATQDEMPFAVKNGISAAAIANGAQYDYYSGDTAVSIASPSIVSNHESHSTVHDRIFSTMKMTAFHELPSAIHDGIIFAGNDSPATVTTTTQVYSSSSSLSSELSAITIMTTAVEFD